MKIRLCYVRLTIRLMVKIYLQICICVINQFVQYLYTNLYQVKISILVNGIFIHICIRF